MTLRLARGHMTFYLADYPGHARPLIPTKLTREAISDFYPGRAVRGAMPCPPAELWGRLSPAQQHDIADEVAAIFHEVIHDYVRTHHTGTSGAQSDHLCAPVHAAANALPSGELAAAYALEQRAVSLGWHPDDVVVIDTDIGVTAASAEQREGFKEVIAQVTLGQVGIILSYDVTRLARNCSDWYPLLDLCGYKRCLIADRDGIYDPGSPNGRLLLGLKGQLSELELHTLRGRLTAGLLNKAERGELALQLPVGLVRDVLGRVVKDPHQEVQDRLSLVFATFLEVRSASKVLQHFNAHDLLLPRRDRFGDIVWKKPTVAALLAILKNPAYAGAFVYGRSRTTVVGPSPVNKTQHRLPMDQWKIRVNDVYPAYVPWETFVRIQAMLRDNYAEYDRNKSRGVPRPGKALLHGIVYCGECGHKLVVQYKGRTQYLCTYLRGQYGVPVCERIPADAVDDAVVDAFCAALAPVELDAYAQAVDREATQVTRVAHAQAQHRERLRYEADLAQRQFTRVDPDNRLVAAELERRWEVALSALKQAEAAASHANPLPSCRCRRRCGPVLRLWANTFPQLWQDGSIGQAHKKALLRALIDKVVVQRVGKGPCQHPHHLERRREYHT